MAKTKQEIIERLIASLKNGEGDLADLDLLMDKAKEDIAAAKKAEAEERARKEKEQIQRGEKVAEMATRVLNDKATEADVAMVMESYMHSLGMQDAKVSPDEVRSAKEAAEKASSALGTLIDLIGDLGDVKDIKVHKVDKKSADDVLREFLKNI